MSVALQPVCRSVAAAAVPGNALDAVACQRLWGAVLIEALRTALGDYASTSNPSRTERERRRSQDWFGSRDFLEVCEMAGVNPEVVMRVYHQRRAQPNGRLTTGIRRVMRS